MTRCLRSLLLRSTWDVDVHKQVTNLHCKDDKMRELSGKYSFTHPGKLEAMKKSVEEEFARCFWSGDVDRAKEELRESLRELVIWERNTIWRVCHSSSMPGRTGSLWNTASNRFIVPSRKICLNLSLRFFASSPATGHVAIRAACERGGCEEGWSRDKAILDAVVEARSCVCECDYVFNSSIGKPRFV